ncbi:MAG: hypothetical protein ACW99A_18920, partial [Candidatus Kariarchaeaceae archaeon]|jgi:hypothetical protein
MVSNSEMQNNSRNENQNLSIHEVYDLSFIEIVTLNHLLRENTKIMRFSLYKKINSILQPHKKLSTSSFYNSLKSLEKRHFIKFSKSESKDPKAIAVEPTEKAMSLIGFFHFFLIQNSIANEHGLDLQVNQVVNSLINMDELGSTLIIEPVLNKNSTLSTSIIPMANETIRIMAKKSKSIFLVSTDEFFSEYIDQGFSNITRSQVMDSGIIREPDNYFDVIVFPLYRKNIHFGELDFQGILHEAKRLLSKEGVLLLIHLEDIPDTSHYFIRILAESLFASGYFTPYLASDIRQNLQKIGFTNIKSQSTNGINFIAAYQVS